jgi:hypothetical protein
MPKPKQSPIWIRLYFQAAYADLARLIGYAGRPLPELLELTEPLVKKYGEEKMAEVSEALTRLDETTDPPIVRFTDEARKLCWQLLGPPPPETQTPAAPSSSRPSQPLDPAAEVRARRANKRQLACMLRDARKSLEHNGRNSFAGKEAKKLIAAAEAEMRSRGLAIPPPDVETSASTQGVDSKQKRKLVSNEKGEERHDAQ